MGIYRHSDDMLITIPLANEEDAYAALIEYAQTRRYPYNGTTVETILREEGFQVDRYEGDRFGNCLDVCYMQEAKHYNLMELFTVLAPFVRDESYCTVIDEEGDHVQYQFDGQNVVEKIGKVVFE